MIQTMYFDLGNVLVLFSHEQMYQQLGDLAALPPSLIRSILMEEGLAYQHETGRIMTQELYSHFLALSKKKFSKDEFIHAASHIFKPNTEIFSIIKQMKEQKIRLILLSNVGQCHFEYIYKTYPILKEFHELILSYKIGACKPSPLIFQKALELAECPSSQCFFIDDIPEYVEAARKAGLDSEIFSTIKTLKKHLHDRGVSLPS